VRPTPATVTKPTPKPFPKPTPRPAPTTRPTPTQPPTPTPLPRKPAPIKPPALPKPAVLNPEDVPLEDEPAIPLPGAPSATAPITASPGAPAEPSTEATPEIAATPAAGIPLTNSGAPPPAPRQPSTPHASGHQSVPPAAEPGAAAMEAPPAETAPPSVFDIWSTYKIDWMRQPLFAGILVALMCAYLGIYVVLKRIVFVGVALAGVSSAGIAAALLLSGLSVTVPPIVGAGVFMLIGVVLFSIHWSPRRVPHESYIGIIYSIATALGVLLISKSAQGEAHMLTLLQGDVLTVAAPETRQMLYAFVVVAIIHGLFSKEFVLVSFDRESASTLGLRAAAWDFLLFLTVGTVIAFATRSVGVLMTSTMLILPAATALLITSRLKKAWLVAPLLGVLPVVVGLHLSLVSDLPASAVIVAVSFFLFLPALIFTLVRRQS